MRQMVTVLENFQVIRPRYEIKQETALQWLGNAHAQAEKYKNPNQEVNFDFFLKLFRRFGCSPSRIESRGTELSDATESLLEKMEILSPIQTHGSVRSASGSGISARAQFFNRVARNRVRQFFENESEEPNHIIHVTCTGYVSPSAVQALVSERNWGQKCGVTHAYHMGCYASLPALRIAEGYLASGHARTEIVHTELCSLHLDLADHSSEQIVVQSLFGDGHIRYTARKNHLDSALGLDLFVIQEEILPNSLDLMTWQVSEWGMKMTLSKEVPKQISAHIMNFIERMIKSVEMKSSFLSDAIFAIHPGGPRIVDQLQQVLQLREEQVSHSKKILFKYGNMSSATLPHIWKEILEDSEVPAGKWILSLAFGPGLTAFGALMRKRC